MDFSLPGSSVHGILQARILEWKPLPSPGDLPDPRIKLGLLQAGLAGRCSKMLRLAAWRLLRENKASLSHGLALRPWSWEDAPNPTDGCAGGAEAVFPQEEGKAVGLGKDVEQSRAIRTVGVMMDPGASCVSVVVISDDASRDSCGLR